jgi:hypothetical protein
MPHVFGIHSGLVSVEDFAWLSIALWDSGKAFRNLQVGSVNLIRSDES